MSDPLLAENPADPGRQYHGKCPAGLSTRINPCIDPPGQRGRSSGAEKPLFSSGTIQFSGGHL